MLFCVLHHPKDAKTHLENKNKKIREAFQWSGIRWLGGRGLHTTRSIAQKFLRVAFNVASDLNGYWCRPVGV